MGLFISQSNYLFDFADCLPFESTRKFPVYKNIGIHLRTTTYETRTHTVILSISDLDSLSRVHLLHLIAQLVHNGLTSYRSRVKRRDFHKTDAIKGLVIRRDLSPKLTSTVRCHVPTTSGAAQHSKAGHS